MKDVEAENFFEVIEVPVDTWRATGVQLSFGGGRGAVDPRYIEFGRARDFP